MSGPPRFAPATFAGQLRFLLRGEPLLHRALTELARSPDALSPLARQRMQSEWARRLLAHLRVDLEIKGDLDPGPEPHVIVALHEGVVDALCLMMIPRPLRVVLREEILGWPRIGPALARMQHIAIDPEQGARAYRGLRRDAERALAAGEHVAIFPQGTLLGIEAAFRCGAFRLAQALRAPILPVVLTGTHRVWEHPFSARLRYAQRVAMTVLPPLPREAVLSEHAVTLCRRLEQRMKSIALDATQPVPRHYEPHRDGYWDGFAFDIDPAWPHLHADVARHRAAIASPAHH